MTRTGRVVITPHAKPEPDLDQIVLAILAAIGPPASPPRKPPVLASPPEDPEDQP